MNPIQTLIAKVEAGEAHLRSHHRPAFKEKKDIAWEAYNGSLDAAISLLEAVLPGWTWSSAEDAHDERWVCIGDRGVVETEEVYAETPARALLLCILKAMEDGE